MAEVIGSLFTPVTSLLNKQLHRLQPALHGIRWTTACEPEMLWLFRVLQPLDQICLSTPRR
jgi:hypothetical protein